MSLYIFLTIRYHFFEPVDTISVSRQGIRSNRIQVLIGGGIGPAYIYLRVAYVSRQRGTRKTQAHIHLNFARGYIHRKQVTAILFSLLIVVGVLYKIGHIPELYDAAHLFFNGVVVGHLPSTCTIVAGKLGVVGLVVESDE